MLKKHIKETIRDQGLGFVASEPAESDGEIFEAPDPVTRY